jgi:hypothetical protein
MTAIYYRILTIVTFHGNAVIHALLPWTIARANSNSIGGYPVRTNCIFVLLTAYLYRGT